MAETKDKKDISVLIEAQVPEFITYDHPKFKKFIEKYYEFMESHKIYFDGFTFNEFKLVPEDDVNFEYFAYEDGDRLQLESVRDTAGNANLQFIIGETVTGNTSGATAVITGTKGNTCAFIKPTNEAVFQFGEKITGSSSRAYSTLANAILAGTFEEGAIESFRDRGPIAATRELPLMQDIDYTNEGMIDEAWKKEFYTNVPKKSVTDRRLLLKRMRDVYRAKGNQTSFQWLFRAIYAKEDLEFYYPKEDVMRLSDGRWTLDKTIKIKADTANNLATFTGKRITGAQSRATAVVESQITSAVGALQITEMYLSDITDGTNPTDGITGGFRVNEGITSEADIDGVIASANTVGIVQTVDVTVGGTNYAIGDEVTITGGGGQDAKGRVASIADSVVEGIDIIDSGDGYSVGDTVKFIDEGTGATSGASAQIKDIIVTGNVVINTDQMQLYKDIPISQADYGLNMTGHNANTHLFANSQLIFSASIKSNSGKYFDDTAPFFGTQFIIAGDRLAKQTRINGSSKTVTQSGTTITLSDPLTEAERRDVIGAKFTYANGNNTIITSYTNTTVFTVKHSHSINAPGVAWNIYYGSNTHWGTIVGANSTQILYSLGSWERDDDLDNYSANNFATDDDIIVYNSWRDKNYDTLYANSSDSHMTHSGITFQCGNTPDPVETTTNGTYEIVDAFGDGATDIEHITIGALNTTTVNVGAINSFSITAGGSGYQSAPVVTVANSYITHLGNALDVMGANNSLLNMNLHNYNTGTIKQVSNTITLIGGSFPDANSGLLTITYANGNTDFVTSVTNSTTIRVASEKNFGINDATQSYTLTFMATANTFAKKALIYNDAGTARARVLDFIDKPKLLRPTVANGNTTLRVDMLTVQDFVSTTEYILNEDGATFVALEDDPIPEYSSAGVFQGNARLFMETTYSDRLTAYDGATACTFNTGTITQSGTTVTVSGGNIPNDILRGTLTYANSNTTTITGYTNATVFSVADTHTISSGQTFSFEYNPALTKGVQRTATSIAGSGSGNRTVTVTDPGGNTELATTNGHHLRVGDKIQLSGASDFTYNGVWSIDSVANNTTYTYTLPQDPVTASPTGEIKIRSVVSGYLDASNTSVVDTSPKGNNATIQISAIAVGAIKSIEVYNFGAGYVTPPTVSTSTGNRNAVLSASIGAFAEYAGYYTGTKGLVSSVPKIEDNKYYQDFSYVLKTDFDVNDYRGHVKRLVHPSGMIMFGEVAFRNKVSAAMFNAAKNNVNSTEANTGKTALTHSPKYRVLEVTTNTYFNVTHRSIASNNETEIYTAQAPWQVIDARIDQTDQNGILQEDYVNISGVTMSNATHFTATDIEHGLEVGDTIQILHTQEDYWNGRYVINSVPTTNTYTFPFYRSSPGLNAQATQYLHVGLEDGTGQILEENGTDQMLMEDSHLTMKREVISFANTFRGKSSNQWDNPYNSSIIREDGGNIILESGGTFLWPKLQFPEGEAGTTTIDMSFNSDILLEDGNEGGSGYLLDEGSGTMGTGPQRYISLEEDTDSADGQYSSIPQLRTHVNVNLFKGLGYDLLMEDGSKITYEDTSLVYSIAVEEWTDGDGNIIGEDGSNLIYEERTFWFGGSQPEDHMMLERQSWTIKQVAPLYQYVDRLTSLGRLSMEDGSLIENEDDAINASYFYLEKKDYGIDKNNVNQVQFNLQESLGFHLMLEDGGHFIEEGDETTRLARFVTGESNFQKDIGSVVLIPDYDKSNSNVTVTFISAPYYQPEMFANVQIVRVGATFNSDDTEEYYLRADLYSYGIYLEDEYGFIMAEDDTRDISGHTVDRLMYDKFTDQIPLPQREITFDRTRTQSDNPMKKWTVNTVGTDPVSDYQTHQIGHQIWGMQPFRPRGLESFFSSATANTKSIDSWFYDYVDTQDEVDTLYVTVVSNQFRFGDTVTSSLANTSNPILSIRRGHKYKFDQSHSSNEGKRLRFSLTNDGSHNSGTEYTTNVTISDDANDMLFEDGDRIQYEDGDIMFIEGFGPGSEGAYTQIDTNIDTDLWNDDQHGILVAETGLYYYSPSQSGMSNKLQQMEAIDNVVDQYWKVLPNYRYNTIQIEPNGSLYQKETTKTYTVTNESGQLRINGVKWDEVELRRGGTYKFDTSDSSMNGHDFSFRDAQSSSGGGTRYETGVTKFGKPGNPNPYTTYTVTASGGKFYIDGTLHPNLTLEKGRYYKFDLSDSSATSHPFRISTIDNGSHAQSTATPFEGQFATKTVTASGGKWYIDGVIHPNLALERGITYRFDVSDSTNTSHVFRLSATQNGTHNSGSEFTVGKIVVGTPGQAGAYVEYTLTSAAPDTLYYYCTNHAGMVPDASDGGKTTLAANSLGTGLTISGTPGQAGAHVTYYISSAPSTSLYYYCTNHSGMGGSATITMSDNTGNYTQIIPSRDTPKNLQYYCHSHGMVDANYNVRIRDMIFPEYVPIQIPFPVRNMEVTISSTLTGADVYEYIRMTANATPRAGYTNYHRPVKKSGSIALDHNGTTGTGTGTSFQSELSVGDVIQIDDESFLTEEDVEILMENDEKLAHETITIGGVSGELIGDVSGVQIQHFKWYIASEDSDLPSEVLTDSGVTGVFTPDPAGTSYNILGEDSNAGLEIGLEDGSGSIISEASDATSTFLLLEDGERLLINEPGEFKISAIASDTSLTVTRKHWGGTDAVPFWKQGTETSTTATVSFV